MIPFKLLWKGKWLSIISPTDIEYEILSEGYGVQILPYLINEQKFIIRKEFCPPYFIKDEKPKLYYTIMSGMIDKGENEDDACFRELVEEAGVLNPNIEWYEVCKSIPVCKSSSYRAQLFILGITDYDLIEPEGDGTEGEEKSISIKVSYEELTSIIEDKNNYDYLLYGVYYKIKDLLREGRLD